MDSVVINMNINLDIITHKYIRLYSDYTVRVSELVLHFDLVQQGNKTRGFPQDKGSDT